MEHYINVIKKYTDFTGRARRKEYWTFSLLNFLFAIIIAIMEAAAGSPGILSLVYFLFALIPGSSVAIRRLHDTNRSGWWILIGIIPVIGYLVFIVMVATDGDEGVNRFGEDPKLIVS